MARAMAMGWLVAVFLLGATNACVNEWTLNPSESLATALSGVCTDGTIHLSEGLWGTLSSQCGLLVTRGYIIKPAPGAQVRWMCNTYIAQISGVVNKLEFHGISFENMTQSIVQYALGGSLSQLIVADSQFLNFKNFHALDSRTTTSTTVTGSLFDNNIAGALKCCGGSGSLSVTSSQFLNNALPSSQGAAINVDTGASFSTTKFINNKVTSGSGGAIFYAAFSSHPQLIVSLCTFKNNAAPEHGGAVYVSGDASVQPLSITNCNFAHNTAGKYGGAIYAANVHVDDGAYESNIAAERGGALYLWGNGASSNSVDGARFTGNRVTARMSIGGAILSEGTISVTHTYFSDNKASDEEGLGGALYAGASAANPTLQAVHCHGNQAYDGGALYLASTAASDPTGQSFVNSTLSGNTALHFGGGIFRRSTTPLTLREVQGSTNTAKLGGAVYSPNSLVTVTQCSFNDNFVWDTEHWVNVTKQYNYTWNVLTQAYLWKGYTFNATFIEEGGHGGALFVETAVLDKNTFIGNFATVAGGAVFARSSITEIRGLYVNNSAAAGGALHAHHDVNLTTSKFMANVAGAHRGGAVYAANLTYVDECIFTANRAEWQGGAVYSGMEASIAQSAFGDNMGGSGGAVHSAHNCIVTGSNFTNNMAMGTGPSWTGGNGGAVSCEADMEDTSNVWHRNSAKNNGGAVAAGSLTSVTGSPYTANTAGGSGGAAYVTGAVDLKQLTFLGNRATDAGGAVWAGGTVEVQAVDFRMNFAGKQGGAVYTNGPATVHRVTFLDNSASHGGAVFQTQHVYALLFHGCPRDPAQDPQNTIVDNGAVSLAQCRKLCDLEPTCRAIEVNGCTASPTECGGTCYLYLAPQHNVTWYDGTHRPGGCLTPAAVAKGDKRAYLKPTEYVEEAAGLNFCSLPGYASINSAKVCQEAAAANNKAFGGVVNNDEEPTGCTTANMTGRYYFNVAPGNLQNAMASPVCRGAPVINTLMVVYSTFTQNKASSTGGGIYTFVEANVTDSVFVANTAQGSGGGAVYYVHNTTIERTHFASNAGNHGGALLADQAGQKLRAAAITFSQNSGTGNGGAIHSAKGVLELEGVSFASNEAASGAAVYSSQGRCTVEDVQFTSNQAGMNGGAIWAQQDLNVATGVTFASNKAKGKGGAIYLETGLGATDRYADQSPVYSDLTINAAVFKGNEAQYGGGVFGATSTNTYIQHSLFESNRAAIRGPSVYHLDVVNTLNNTYTDNHCPMDPRTYMNVWFQPDERRTVGSLYIHWIVPVPIVVGNQLKLSLPMDIELDQCGLGYDVQGCNTTVHFIDGNLPRQADKVLIDRKTNHFVLSWEETADGVLNMTQSEVYVLRVSNIRTPNHCENLTYSVHMQHCRMTDVLNAGKYFRRDCMYEGEDYIYQTTFMTEELTGTPKGCSPCNACWRSEWDGIWRCHHGNGKYFSRSALEPTCTTAT
mmetsp:Transcript_62896/g.112174  ORF Transcript_62896/g.112174 Transcript_62896/m.112174 type:complete len:1454 (-) Transcript_62896:322-4683(-)